MYIYMTMTLLARSILEISGFLLKPMDPHQWKMECPFSSYLNTFNYSCMHN